MESLIFLIPKLWRICGRVVRLGCFWIEEFSYTFLLLSQLIAIPITGILSTRLFKFSQIYWTIVLVPYVLLSNRIRERRQKLLIFARYNFRKAWTDTYEALRNTIFYGQGGPSLQLFGLFQKQLALSTSAAVYKFNNGRMVQEQNFELLLQKGQK